MKWDIPLIAGFARSIPFLRASIPVGKILYTNEGWSGKQLKHPIWPRSFMTMELQLLLQLKAYILLSELGMKGLGKLVWNLESQVGLTSTFYSNKSFLGGWASCL
ncbi:hypothetical protein AMTRI_Chr08g203920 [Amborella trichopoda]